MRIITNYFVFCDPIYREVHNYVHAVSLPVLKLFFLLAVLISMNRSGLTWVPFCITLLIHMGQMM
jgi:hypothetical protein